jgi:cytochrome b
MTADLADSSMTARREIPVWDVPTRLFHWMLVLLIAFSWSSADARRMDWHRYSGYAVLGLLAFRILWGFVGSSTARFAGFVRSPAATVRYVRGETSGIGHNPLGGWSVLAMLGLLALQVGLGLFAVDVDGFESGPLSDRVSFEAGRQAAEWHHLVFNSLLALIALHVAAVFAYLVFRRDNLIRPMINGTRPGGEGDAPMQRGSLLGLVACVALAALAAWAVAKGLRF